MVASMRGSLPDDLPRGDSEGIQFIKPRAEWKRCQRWVEEQEEVALLMTGADDGKPPKNNLLHALAQFPGPVAQHGGVSEAERHYCQVTAVVIAAFKKHDGLDWQGGKNDDTALMKACGNGNSYVAKELVKAGASEPLPRLFPHWVGSFFVPQPGTGPVGGCVGVAGWRRRGGDDSSGRQG